MKPPTPKAILWPSESPAAIPPPAPASWPAIAHASGFGRPFAQPSAAANVTTRIKHAKRFPLIAIPLQTSYERARPNRTLNRRQEPPEVPALYRFS